MSEGVWNQAYSVVVQVQRRETVEVADVDGDVRDFVMREGELLKQPQGAEFLWKAGQLIEV